MSLPQIYGTLTVIQSASALTFSVFYFTHATQFLAAPFGGIELSNKYLLLGRPLYQDEHLEPILVTGAAIVHVVSGLAKGAIRLYWGRKGGNQQSNSTGIPYHRFAGYALMPILTVHYKAVRDLPRQHFGDSAFLDYTYISFMLQSHPTIAYVGHAALISFASYHVVGGMKFAIDSVFKGRRRQNEQPTKPAKIESRSSGIDTRRAQMLASLSVSALAIYGLYVIGKAQKIPLRHEYAKIYQRLISFK
ncbi:hypothetical protein INT43_003940 [Umbelopsis isabellina]|uniref:Mitochondrial adapter protein MCP1 transmembrane domain-containing protein n=1 Tax=Mortierella isabellina TaxID=91625 RepID=A0A8H7PTR1_MORIS|nr:hypothetical protein INT43_003940 [Umbelopsis isabellina]